MKSAAASLLVLALAAAPGHAATRDDAYQSFQRCNVIHDNRTWLDCIYGAVQPVRAELNLAPASETQVRLVPQGELTTLVPMPAAAARPAAVTHPEPKHEGLLSYMLGGRAQVEAVPFRAYNFSGDGHFTVTLANGQVWQQVGDDGRVAQWKADPARYLATIKTGTLGSSILQVKGETGAFLVKQVP